MMVEAQERAEREGKPLSSAPPMSTWSADIEALTTVADRLASIAYILRATNGDKTAQPPKPAPRPTTLLDSIKRERRQERHEKLTARLLRR